MWTLAFQVSPELGSLLSLCPERGSEWWIEFEKCIERSFGVKVDSAQSARRCAEEDAGVGPLSEIILVFRLNGLLVGGSVPPWPMRTFILRLDVEKNRMPTVTFNQIPSVIVT